MLVIRREQLEALRKARERRFLRALEEDLADRPRSAPLEREALRALIGRVVELGLKHEVRQERNLAELARAAYAHEDVCPADAPPAPWVQAILGDRRRDESSRLADVVERARARRWGR